MKRFTIIFAILGFLVFGCIEESSIVGPDLQVSQNIEKTWVELPSNLKLSKTETVSKLIDGQAGGKINFKIEFEELKVKGNLKIEKKSFEGEEELFITLDDQTTSATFGPSPFEFNKPLLYTVKYTGLDLEGFNPEDFDFYYLSAGGELVKAEYNSLYVNIKKGVLKVTKAKIPHFSRYGFAR